MSWLPYLALASVYPIVSCWFLRRPFKRFIHPLPINTLTGLPLLQVKTSSHRGGAAEAPENTLAAFDWSDHLNINHFELDVHLTKDKKVVVYHDYTVDRLSEKVKGYVREFKYKDIPPLATSIPLPPPFHAHHAVLNLEELQSAVTTSLVESPNEVAQQAGTHDSPVITDLSPTGNARRAPLLEEVFERYPDRCINIDVKENNEELMEETAKLIEKYKREALTIWGSGKDELSQKMYTRNPEIPLFFSARQIGFLYLKYLTGILPFTHLKETALEIPLFTPQLKKRMAAHGDLIPPDDAKGLKARLIRVVLAGYHRLATSGPLIRHLQARNIKVIYWVLNTEEEFELAYSVGADGVMTDFPSKLQKYWQAKGRQSTTTNSDTSSHEKKKK